MLYSRIWTATSALAVITALTGCASGRQRLVIDKVGPAPACAPSANSSRGSLVVFSECEADVNASTPFASDSLGSGESTGYSWEYSSYKILASDGKVVRHVNNNEGTTVLHPEQVTLPVGNYIVVASADHYGRVTVPVQIAGGQVTVLHLGSGGFWPNEDAFTPANSVHLPDGRVVGWRAFASTASSQ